MAFHLAPGDRFYCGYFEWAVHPDEAAVILARGSVSINGVWFRARQMDTIGIYPLIRVEGLEEYGPAHDPQASALSKVGRPWLEAVA